MLSKKDFIEALDVIAEYHRKEEALTKALHECFMDGHSVVSFTGKLEGFLLKQICMNISEENWQDIYDNLSLFVYEYDFGEKPYEVEWHITTATDNIVRKYSIKSNSEMYDWLAEFFRKDDK